MLRFLHIRNFALIEEARIDFQRGLTVLTGETGAGKSLVLDALGLLAGMRASPSIVRSGANRATVEAVFEVSPDSSLLPLLEESGLESEEPGEVILRREVLASGRGRASANGRLIPLTLLEKISHHLLEIGTQHEQFALLQRDAQQEVFDTFSNLLPLRTQYTKAWSRVTELRQELARRQGDDREREQRRDFLAYQVEELEAAGLRDGELEELQIEARRLGNVEVLAALASEVDGHLNGDDIEASGVRDLLSRAIRTVEQMASHDASLDKILTPLEQAAEGLSEAAFALMGYAEKLEVDPKRLMEVEERITTVRGLLRKHGPSVIDAINRLEEMRAELAELNQWEDAGAALMKELAAAEETAMRLARDLTAARKKAVVRFTRPLVAILRDFSLPKVRIALEMAPPANGIDLGGKMKCDSRGAETVEILFSANDGEPPQPLRRIGSGGELSRVMLALRTLAGEASRIPLMVFDEVDAGISGQAARHVAERLAALSRQTQILAVTHNPTVAAQADHQLLVEKSMEGGRTSTHVLTLDNRQRQEELARLLDGGKLSVKSLALAEELLAQTA
ncbi:MAG: DNA repair protein RecN [Candidatus Sumerlaeia bacterium]|nr:DNA repair protein RecN [Candidatus Sumerlaeia bacterium]